MPRLNQNGFGSIALVLVFIVISAAVGAGIYVSRSQNKEPDNKTNTPKISSFAECVAAGNPILESFPEQCVANGQTFTNTSQQATDKPDGGEYLEIKEWNVRFKLTDANSDAYYVIHSDRPEHAYFSLVSIKDVDECAANKTSLAALSRFKDGDKEQYEDKTLLEMYPNSPKIGEYYYYVSGAQAACSDDDSVNAKSMLARQAYTNLLPGLEEIPN